MLTIHVKKTTLWDDVNEEFMIVGPQTLQLEHTLVTLSEWESKWKIPFASDRKKTTEEMIDYIKIMTVTPNVPEEVYYALTPDHYDSINEYIKDPMTATWFSKNQSSKKNNKQEQITAELIYYSMIALNIPVDVCQHWHLNRLLTLIEVCNRKNQPPKKMSQSDVLRQNASINAKRRAQLKPKG